VAERLFTLTSVELLIVVCHEAATTVFEFTCLLMDSRFGKLHPQWHKGLPFQMTTSGPTHRRSIHLHLCTRTFGTPIDLPARVQITRNKMSQTRAHSNLREFTAEYHTPQRTRFFDAFHAKPPDQTIFAFVKEHKHQDWCPSQNTNSAPSGQSERPPAIARRRT